MVVCPSCAACVSQRIPLDCHKQLIGKIEAISLLNWGSACRQNRSKSYWSLDREKAETWSVVSDQWPSWAQSVKMQRYFDQGVSFFLFFASCIRVEPTSFCRWQITNTAVFAQRKQPHYQHQLSKETLNSWFPLGDTFCWCYNLRACRWQQPKLAMLSLDCCAVFNRLRETIKSLHWVPRLLFQKGDKYTTHRTTTHRTPSLWNKHYNFCYVLSHLK